jgi:hypothetical protein
MIWVIALIALAAVWWASDLNELWALVVAVPLILQLL